MNFIIKQSAPSWDTISSRLELLKAIGQALSGNGVEFGAGANPFPLNKNCQIRYADRNTSDQLLERGYFGEASLVHQNLTADMESMEGIPFESLDFIIASHVIEHTSNPLRALRSSYQRLRRGGCLVLVVPDKSVTFDRERGLTTLEHVIADYTRPSRERDWEHYIEFFSKAFPQPDPIASARGVFERGDDIHFHVWTYETFSELIEYVRKYMDPWSSVWSRRRIANEDIEFYLVLTK